MEIGSEFGSVALPNNNPQRQRSAEVGNASYIFDLLLSVISVSGQIVGIVEGVGEDEILSDGKRKKEKINNLKIIWHDLQPFKKR